MYDDVEYVYEVYKEKSFSAAAKNLFVSQPALSSAIKKIESKLGITIFDRSSQPIALTEEGKVYIEAVERIRTIKNGLETRLSDISKLKTGHITVSGENYISSFIYPRIIIEFMERYGGIDIEMVESNSHDLQNQLLSEDVDLLIDYKFDPELYLSYPLTEEHIILCVPKKLEINERLKEYQLTARDIKNGKHLKNGCGGVHLKEFCDETFVILKKGNYSHRHSMELCAEAGFTPKVKIYPDQMITSYNMSRAGMGISMIPDLLVYSSPTTGRCVYYKIASKSSLRTLNLGFKKNRYMSRAVEAFIKTALEVYK
jgi:DNA-binding transcriptional LysR family regulator